MSLSTQELRLRLSSGRPTPAEVLEHTVVALAVGTFVWVLRSSGGRDLGVMAPAIGLTLPAALVTRPWERIGPAVSLLLTAVPLGGLVACLLTPLHFNHSEILRSLTYGPLVFLAFVGYCRTPARRTALAAIVCVAGFWEFWQAFVAWRGQGRPSNPMVGTFYQRDMYGAFCVAVTALSLGLATTGPAWQRAVGSVTGPVAAVGVVLSGGRAPEALLVFVWLGSGLVLVCSRRRLVDLLIWLGLGGATVLLLLLMVSPWVFPRTGHFSFSTAVSGTSSQSGTSAAGASVAVREAYWHVGVDDFFAHPVIGQGFGSYGITFPKHADLLPAGQKASIYAHDAVLQNLAEGGLVAGVPLAAAALGILAMAVRALWRSLHELPDAAVLGGGLATLALLAHALFDFDWAYPALAGMLGLVAAPAGAGLSIRLPRWSHLGLAVVAVAAAAFMVYPVAAYASVRRSVEESAALAASTRYGAAAHRADTTGWLGLMDSQASTWLVQQAAAVVQSGRPDPFPAPEMGRAVVRTASVATVDPAVALDRAWVRFAAGDRAGAVATGAAVVRQVDSYRPDLITSYAGLLVADGQVSRAEDLLLTGVERFARSDYWAPPDVIDVAALLQTLAGPDADSTACAWALVEEAFPGPAAQLTAPLATRPPPRTCAVTHP